MKKNLILVVCSLAITLHIYAQTELIVNGDFSKSSGWQTELDFHFGTSFSCYNNSTGYAYLSSTSGGAINNAGGTLSQTKTIPSTASSATLTFYYSITTQETTTTQQYDYLQVFFCWNSCNGSQNVVTLSNLDKTGTNTTGCNPYKKYTYKIPTSLFGKSLTLWFQGSTDGGKPTVFRIDDVSLIYNSSAPPPSGQTGSVKVNINPSSAVSAGAQWRLDNSSTYNNSGATLSGISPGAHTVYFKTISGWNTPSSQSINVSSNNTTTITGTYTQVTTSYLISGTLKDVSLSNNGTLNNSNTSGIVSLYNSNGSLVDTYSTGSDGHFEFTNLSNSIYKIKASKTGSFTSNVEISNVVPQSNIVVKIPYSLLKMAKDLATTLETKDIPQSYFGGLAYFTFHAKGYNESDIKSLLASRQTITSNHDKVIESLARLYIAQNALKAYSDEGAVMTEAFATSIFDICFSVYHIVTIRKQLQQKAYTSGFSSAKAAVIDQLLRATAVLFFEATDKLSGALANLIKKDDVRTEVKKRLGEIMELMKRIAENSKVEDFVKDIVEDNLKNLLSQKLTELLFETVFVRYLTQNNVFIAYANANGNNFNGNLQSAFSNVQSSISNIHQQTDQKQDEIDKWNSISDFSVYTGKLADAIYKLNSGLGVEVLDVEVFKLGMDVLKNFISMGTSFVPIYKSWNQLLNIHYDLLDATSMSFARVRNLPARSARFTGQLSAVVNKYNDGLSQLISKISSNDKEGSLLLAKNLLELDDTLNSNVNDNINYFNMAGPFISSSVAGLDSIDQAVLNIVSANTYIRRRLYVNLTAYYLDNGSQYKDSILTGHNAVMSSNNSLVQYFNDLNNLLSPFPLPAAVFVTGTLTPRIVEVSKSFPVKIYYKNYTTSRITGLYGKIETFGGFTSSVDSVYIGSLDPEKIDSIGITLNAPIDDTIGGYRVSFFDSNGTGDAVGISITAAHAPQSPVLNFEGKCEGDSLILFATAIKGARYYWNGPNGFNSTLPNPVIPAITMASSGTYTCSIDFNGLRSLPTSLNIVVSPRPSVSISGNPYFCENSSTVLTANGADTYRWSTNQSTSQLIVSSPSIYTVIGSSTAGCQDTANVNVIKVPLPVISLAPEALVVQGETINLGESLKIVGNSPYLYKWYPNYALNSDSIKNPIAKPHLNTIYTVKVSDKYGCTATASIKIVMSGVFVYPTPAKTFINVFASRMYEGNYIIRLISSSGQIVYTEKVHTVTGEINKKITVTNFAAGLYFLCMQGEGSIHSFPVIISR